MEKVPYKCNQLIFQSDCVALCKRIGFSDLFSTTGENTCLLLENRSFISNRNWK